jgi:hypothetical protein
MKKPVSIETYEKMLAYQRWYYANMTEEQRTAYLYRKHLYYLAKKKKATR